MKIWCETCKGSGKTTTCMTLGEGIRGIGQCVTTVCKDCSGLGYNELVFAQIDGTPETQRMLEIGRATVEAFEAYKRVSIHCCSPNYFKAIDSIKELLEWHKEMEAKG